MPPLVRHDVPYAAAETVARATDSGGESMSFADVIQLIKLIGRCVTFLE